MIGREVQADEAPAGGDARRNPAVELVAGQVYGGQAPALLEERGGYLADEAVAAEIDDGEIGEAGEVGVQESGEVVAGEGEDGEGLEIEEAAVYLAGETEGGEIELGDAAGGGVAFDVGPVAGFVGVLGPGGEGSGWVHEGGLEDDEAQEVRVQRRQRRMGSRERK